MATLPVYPELGLSSSAASPISAGGDALSGLGSGMGLSVFNMLRTMAVEQDKKSQAYDPYTGQAYRSQRGDNRDKEQRRMAALARVQSVLGETPEYKRSEEAGQVQQAYGAGAATTRGIGDEMVRIAGTRASQDAPGLAIRKEQVGQFAESAIDQYIESGGVTSLGGVLKMREEQASSLVAISEQAAARKRQSEQDYTNALMNRAGMESQAVGMEGAGLQAGITEHGKEYQGQLAQTMPYVQYAITQAGNSMAQQK